MDSVRSGPFGQIFRPDNFIFGQVSLFLSSQTRPGSLLGSSQDAHSCPDARGMVLRRPTEICMHASEAALSPEGIQNSR